MSFFFRQGWQVQFLEADLKTPLSDQTLATTLGDDLMWKETAATEPPKTTAQPVTEEELHALFERLDSARDIFRQTRELREVLSRREIETRELRSRNAELEEIVRKFAPMLLDVATTMELAAKNDTPSQAQPNPQLAAQ